MRQRIVVERLEPRRLLSSGSIDTTFADHTGSTSPAVPILDVASPATISGHAYVDLNGDGNRETGEPPYPGATAFLDLNGNNQLDSGEPQATTGADGSYLFTGITPGLYRLSLVIPVADLGMTAPAAGVYNPIVVHAGDAIAGIDFGIATTGSITGTVYDGDPLNHSGLPNRTVFIDSNFNHVLDAGEQWAMTDCAGHYALANVRPGSIDGLELLQPDGWKSSDTYPHFIHVTPGQQVVENFSSETGAQNRYLDGTFGSNGIARFGAQADFDANATLLQLSAGSILISGESGIYRFTASGQLDNTFGSGGFAASQVSGFARETSVLAPDGKIVEAGQRFDPTQNKYFRALVRYNTDGSLDTSFAANGLFIDSVYNDIDINQILVRPDGSLLVALLTPQDMAQVSLIRLTVTGQLDPSFGTGGRLSLKLDGSDPATTTSGPKMVISWNNGNPINEVIARVNDDGTLDAMFGASGVVKPPAPATLGTEYINTIAVQNDGKIIAAGNFNFSNGFRTDFFLLRLNSDGSVDSKFGTGGMVQSTFFSNGAAVNSAITSLTVAAGGQIVATGGASTTPSAPGDLAVAEYNSNGTPDFLFGYSGLLSASIGAGADVGTGAIVQSDGKVIVVGPSIHGASSLALTRFAVSDETSSIAGTVYFSRNGIRIRDVGNLPLNRGVVFIDTNLNGQIDAGEVSASVDSNGAYTLPHLAAGTYWERLILPPGDTLAAGADPQLVTVNYAQAVTGVNFIMTAKFPIAQAGGPYVVKEGASITLSGGSSSENGGSITSYEWDLHYDGHGFNTDATGPSVTYTAGGYDGPSTEVAALRVTDALGLTAIAIANVSIQNAPPSATFSAVDVVIGSDGTLSFKNASDSLGDLSAGFRYSYDFNNDGTFEISDSLGASAVIPASYLPTAGIYTVRGRIKDKDGAYGDYTTSFNVTNPIPVANAGGPYSVKEGASVNLDASNSFETGGTIARYEWDTNYDGTTFVPRATGVTAAFSAVGLDGPATRTVALRVTDGNSVTAVATATINITNASPTAKLAPLSTSVTAGSSGSVSFSAQSDPSPADVAAGFKYSYDFNNDGKFEITDSSSASASVPAAYLATAGIHTIHGRIKDKDGGFTDYTTTITVIAPKLASISGEVFADNNGNAKLDAGELGVSGRKIYIDKNKNGVLDAGEPTFTTGANGAFTFNGLVAGTYRVRDVLPLGWRRTSPTSGYFDVTVSAGQVVTGKNFAETTRGLISGIVFKDANGNGIKDSTEIALSGWVVFLDTNNNGKLDAGELSFTTGSDGKFSFVVPAGTYHLREVLKSGFKRTAPSAGVYTITLGSGQSSTGKNFGDR